MGLNESRVFVCIKYKNNKTSAIPAKKRQALLCPVTWVRTEKFPAQLTSTPKNIGNIEEDRRDGTGRRCCLWDEIDSNPCHTSFLAARMIRRKVFGRTSILGGWWFDVVWTGRSSIFLKHPFRQASVLLFIHFFKSSCAMYIYVYVVQHGIELNPSPKQHQRPLPSLLYLFFMAAMDRSY